MNLYIVPPYIDTIIMVSLRPARAKQLNERQGQVGTMIGVTVLYTGNQTRVMIMFVTVVCLDLFEPFCGVANRVSVLYDVE